LASVLHILEHYRHIGTSCEQTDLPDGPVMTCLSLYRIIKPATGEPTIGL
jgi:hypothetical protein